MSTASRALRLEPAADAERDGDAFIAHTVAPWLRIDFGGALPKGRWIDLAYAASLFDAPTRPVLRWVTGGGDVETFLPAAVFGRAFWTGFVPTDAREALISPVATPGRFGFVLESCAIAPLPIIAARAFRNWPSRTLGALLNTIRGLPAPAREDMILALGGESLANYAAWRARRLRPLDLGGLDRPRCDWRGGPHIRLAVGAGGAAAAEIAGLVAALDAQPYPHWSLAAIGAAPEDAIARGRVVRLDAGAPLRALAAGLDDAALIGRLARRDRLPEAALATLAEHAVRAPAVDVFYGDEDRIDPAGQHRAPRFKPDWSPAFQADADYIGAAAFVRARRLRDRDGTADAFADPNADVGDCVALTRGGVDHVRRILLSRATSAQSDARARRPATPRMRGVRNDPFVSILVPTRDQVGLLRQCVTSVAAKAGATRYEMIVIDNGSADAEALAYLATLEADARYRVLRRPGPFNFSALNNDAAAHARGDYLLLLNNDTQAVTQDWLACLLAHAARDGVGAVGAKLLFPSRRIQHAGVAIGLAGRAGHTDAHLRADDPGYLGRVAATRDVAAVTGACLLVAKAKFDAIGGLDAENLPIDFNDVDFCLRLRERGWSNLYTPDCVLIHHESVSRGSFADPSRVYAKEWAYFTTRWRDLIRDDPYFHPALSQYFQPAALG